MTTDYQVIVHHATGERIGLIERTVALEYARVVNEPGRFSLQLPIEFDALLAIDRRISIWRKLPGGEFYRDFYGFIRSITHGSDQNGDDYTQIGGPGLADLLRRRIVAYETGTAQANKAEPADNMMKAIVRENLGSLAGARAISATYFTVDADMGLGPAVANSCAYLNVMDVLVSVADMARQAGSDVYFDIVPTSDGTMIFRTWTTQPGIDRRTSSGSPVLFSTDFYNIENPQLSEAWDDEANAIYGGGLSGLTAARYVSEQSDAARQAISVFGRTEYFANESISDSDAEVDDLTKAVLIARRPVQRFSASIVDSDRARYGRAWGFGDRVSATYRKRKFDCLIRAVSVSLSADGQESINASMEAYL